MRCDSEIQSYSPSFQAHQEDPAVWVIGEGVYGSSLLGNVHGPIQLDTLDARLPNHCKLFRLTMGKIAKVKTHTNYQYLPSPGRTESNPRMM